MSVDKQVARKTSGSYYTPDSLVQQLLKSALHPLIVDRVMGPDPVDALLSMTVCEPSCGAGVFLAAATERIAQWVAFLRTGDLNPDQDALTVARRDVVERCAYGVDLNPVAVDLTRAALWVRALTEHHANPFISHHIRHGNALIGATPALIDRGIPDAAFHPIEGDDPAVARALRRQNKTEREAAASRATEPQQGALF